MRARSTRAIAAAVLAAAFGLTAGIAGTRVAMAGGLNLSRGTQGYLGVDIRDVSDEQVSVLKLHEARGAEVLRVDHDGPAGKAGLREHDVILQLNGEVIQGQEQLRRMLHETPAGRAVTLVISRDGQQQIIKTELANREEVERRAWQDHLTVPDPAGSGDTSPVDPGPVTSGPLTAGPGTSGGGGRVGGPGAGVPSTPGSMGFLHGPTARSHNMLGSLIGAPYTGAMVEAVGPQLAQFFGVTDGTGLLVSNVDTNSPAATAGLRAGDVVLKANQTVLGDPADWSRAMHESKGKPVTLTVLREKREQTLTLTPDAKHRSAMAWPADGGFAGLAPGDTEELVAELRLQQEPDLAAAQKALRAQQDAFREEDLRRLLDDARRGAPDPAQLQEQLRDSDHVHDQIYELRKQMMRSMPGSMD